ncbi:hypothetical protein X963_5687 [Burkholderia pseudomallei MSHR7498]|nr:hypothetical protein X962_5822 [Burkholderia pseudomallei MSHR7343]KGS91848.1 hypothetical protein X963_5687 [Burkholderia pseudomallei MSHR7498]
MRQTNRYSLNRLLHVSSDMDSARLFRRAFFWFIAENRGDLENDCVT